MNNVAVYLGGHLDRFGVIVKHDIVCPEKRIPQNHNASRGLDHQQTVIVIVTLHLLILAEYHTSLVDVEDYVIEVVLDVIWAFAS